MATDAGAPIVVDDFFDEQAYFQGQIDAMQAQIDGLVAQPACRGSHSGDQIIPIATLMPIILDAADSWDFGGCHTPGASQIYNPGARGLCRGIGSVTWEPETLGYRNLYIQINGTTTISVDFRDGIAGTTNGVTIPWDALLEAGDYVEMLVYYDISGGSPSSLHCGAAYLTFSRYRDA